jgi:photosystem II stability/assembly factor-like uncharacterized protein
VYVVGSFGTILNYNGATWKNLSNPCLSIDNFYEVWGTGRNDVYVLGASGAVFHYGGTAAGWNRVMAPVPGLLLDSIWGTSFDDLFVCGNWGTIMHFDGTDWTLMPIDYKGTFRDIRGTSSNDVFAVGTLPAALFYYNGTQWTELTQLTDANLTGICFISDEELIVVGSHGAILRCTR